MALEYALAKIFMLWGIVPDYVMGHSLGEYSALCISGALTLEDALRVVATRAKLMTDNCLPGTSGMLACNLGPQEVEQLISEDQNITQLTITCLNGIGDCVVGGPLDQLDLFQMSCKRRKVKSKLLDVPYAFHSPAMDPILEPLQELGRSIKFERPTIPVMSNVFGRLFEEGDFSSDYFALHARQPVRFSECLMGLQSREVLDDVVFIEIGPQPTTIPMLRSSIYSNSCTYLGTLQRGQDAWTSVSSTLAAISLRKIPVDWRKVFTGTSAKMTSLPGHLLDGSSYLVPYQEPLQVFSPTTERNSKDLRTKTGFALLPWLNTQASSNEKFVLETTLAILGPLISGHDVGGSPICPASVFHELALEAAQTMLEPPEGQVLVISEMIFASPLVYVPSQETNVTTVSITRNDSLSSADFRITSCSTEDHKETLHCTGCIAKQDFWTNPSHWRKDAALVARQSRHFSGVGRDNFSTFRTKVLYEAIFTRVVRYSPAYQSLLYLNVADSNLEGVGSFRLPSSSSTSYLAHPVFTDTLLHAAGFIANLAVRSDEVGICARVESIEKSYRDIDYADSFTVYCSLLDLKGTILADAIALNSSGNVVAVIRGMEFKRLRLSAFQHMLSRQSIALEPREIHSASAKPLLLTGLVTPPMTGDIMNSPMEASGGLLQGVSQTLKGIVMDVGGFSERDMDYTKSLDELGIDSLMEIEIVSKLTRVFPGQAGLDHHALSECETLESLENRLLSILQPSVEIAALIGPPMSTGWKDSHQSAHIPSKCSPSYGVQKNPAALHNSDGKETPLCLFHDGSGQVNMYARFQDHDRSLYAFSDPHFGSGKRFHSVIQMAEFYASQLDKSRYSPLIVGGWSFGGVVAFEAAQQLMANGFEVKGLILIDSPYPVNHEPLPNAVIANIVSPSSLSHHALNGRTELIEEFRFNASLLGSYEAVPFSRTNKLQLRTVMLRSQEVLDTESLCGVRYDWLSNQKARDAAILAWEGLVGGHIEVLPIPGNHFEPFSQNNIDETGAQLWRACRYIKAGSVYEF
ncbi:thioesterase domain-containing protein [Xylariales sp. AK1849]|nr:thioesterase domain-containing protein [Xylariales sp. AK1849]